MLTRSTDVYVTLSERARIANEANADLFVSFHENSASSPSATGYEDYISPTAQNITVAVREAFHRVVTEFLTQKGIRNRGMKSASFQVLRETTMPAILVEHLFISNPNDLILQTDVNFINEAAQMYARAIRAALATIGKSNGTVCLDAGHGGEDAGATNGNEYEKNHVLRLVLHIKSILSGAQIDVSNKIGYKVVEGANAFRIQSGRYGTKADMMAAMNEALQQQYLYYAQELNSNSDEKGWRFISGKYTTQLDARTAAERALRDGKLKYVTLIGTIE
ncbi:N-acetylmuramoyl-L-alanine amidase [Lysinibacillus sp. KU-BSD001]|uniref:N-acetylmuramoyl-L-alanine amidase n=1 Tax=Lysinibacillus sp. KU-BSD001 TaxID=3141328 RepID=UPI0036E5E41C